VESEVVLFPAAETAVVWLLRLGGEGQYRDSGTWSGRKGSERETTLPLLSRPPGPWACLEDTLPFGIKTSVLRNQSAKDKELKEERGKGQRMGRDPATAFKTEGIWAQSGNRMACNQLTSYRFPPGRCPGT
jgi:hypothetical protein